MNVFYRVAMLCGALPLVAGVSVFLLWLVTRWDWLMIAGVVILYGGVIFFLVGITALASSCWLAFRTPGLSRRRFWFSTIACAGLLLSNFPVAGGILATVIAMKTCYTVTVHNNSAQPLSDVRVFGGGCEADFGTIPPGGVVQRRFWIECEGPLEFCAVRGAATHNEIIDGYATSMGGRTTVTLDADGTISVSHDND